MENSKPNSKKSENLNKEIENINKQISIQNQQLFQLQEDFLKKMKRSCLPIMKFERQPCSKNFKNSTDQELLQDIARLERVLLEKQPK